MSPRPDDREKAPAVAPPGVRGWPRALVGYLALVVAVVLLPILAGMAARLAWKAILFGWNMIG